MTKHNRWLLPEGVEEILPSQAWPIQFYQQAALALFSSWGYDLVIPPLLEYTDSLLLDQSADMDLQTFKLVDQLSGRSMGLRADITPQTCRIDAHSLQQNSPLRLCYAGTVVHCLPKSQLASRTPIEVGAELFGVSSLDADLESIQLMLAAIGLAGIADQNVHLDLGHVRVYRGLVEAANLSAQQSDDLFDAFDRKALSEIDHILQAANVEAELAEMIKALVNLHGDVSILEQALSQLAKAPESVCSAIIELQQLAASLQQQSPNTPLFFDLAELRGFTYHTGIVFAAYIDGLGHSVANGGRFDNMGEVFGRGRPASGFSVNVKALLSLVSKSPQQEVILAPPLSTHDAALQQLIAELRSQQHCVICGQNDIEEVKASHIIERVDDQWLVQPLSS
ncbi:MAG: ATP phosphoribosyltransferase regulatory subunit [Pseudomonadales bacterium]|nr:ATP phosphoribosyltransferase regulatory subunit [Pseudomonadales bacterium]